MSAEQPNPTAQQPQGRDAKGRFTTGNAGGPGNPFGRRLADMRKAVMNAISVDDIEALLRKLLEMAMAGDIAAAKLVLQYAVGKPKPVAEPDRTEIEAWEIEKQSWTPPDDVYDVMEGMPVRCASASSDAMSDVRCRQFGDMILTGKMPEEKPLTEEERQRSDRELAEINAQFEARLAAGEFDEINKILFPDRPPSGPTAAPSSAGANGQNGNGKHHKSNENGRHRPSPAAANGQKQMNHR